MYSCQPRGASPAVGSVTAVPIAAPLKTKLTSFRDRVVGQEDRDLRNARSHAVEGNAVPALALSGQRVVQDLRVETEQHGGAPRALVARPVRQARMIGVSGARELDPRLLNLLHQQRAPRSATDEVDGVQLVDQSEDKRYLHGVGRFVARPR